MMGSTASISSNVLSFSQAQRLRAASRRMSADEVHADILEAIFDQRLIPGQVLTAVWIGRAYRVSRGTVAHVMERLSLAGLIEKRSGRVARLITLDAAALAQTVQARRHAERCIAVALAGNLGNAQISALRALALRERQYAERQEVAIAIRLANEFHAKLAELTGNKPLIRFYTPLVALNSLAMAHQPDSTLAMKMWQTRLALTEALVQGAAEKAERWVEHLMQQVSTQLSQRN
ncbi:GntR family transcriptional regulator [Pseudomonas sp. R5(2019)]|uniref:GntR family transcriptional regulator n=1 Tax=Pseudomonas sp. R5(2019) TaxID=2697566 RepID=UPI0014131914|nr:GntR family transcriptional regulator [Pseudomonas sp. R5(2019)]NBA93398.1 FCD domain-containing protein [Pseudomonas sp. R5(2019)]